MRKSKIFILIILLLLLMSVVIYAAPESGVEGKIYNLEYREVKSDDTSAQKEGLYSGESLLFEKNSAEMQLLLEQIKVSAKEDAISGLSKIYDTLPTRDNVELLQWGIFLSKYTDKEITEYPVGDITFTIGLDTYNIKASKSAKGWVKDYVLPVIFEGITSENMNYPAAMYKLDISNGQKLVDISIDMKNSKNFVEFYKVYPFTGKQDVISDSFLIYNTGTYYGLALNKDYVEVLKGYHNELKYLKGIDVEVPACVNTLSYITLPKNLSNYTLSDKVLQDMAIYKGLAVNLVDKQLIDTNNATTDNVTLLYKDYSLQEEDLILVPLKDSIVVVQPKYVEYFNKWGKELNTAHSVDFTNFFMTESEIIQITDMSTNNQFDVNLRTYVSDNGLVSLRLDGRYAFGVYVRSDSMPYDRILKRLYGPDGSTVVKEEELEKITKSIESQMKSQGKSKEFNEYMKAAGVSSFPIIVIPILLILVILIVIFVIVMRNRKKKKLRQNVNDNSDLLFNPDEEDIEEDEDVNY